MIDDPGFYACIYAAPKDADIGDEAVWRACAPVLGDFRSLEDQPIDADPRFGGTADWDACTAPVDANALAGWPRWGGLNLGSTQDLTALVPSNHFWCNSDDTIPVIMAERPSGTQLHQM